MEWNEFVENVQRWAAERGVYEHSTPDAQLLKALSEVGELADAYAKKDTDGIIDGVGDIAVCLVNYQAMIGGNFNEFQDGISSWGAASPAQTIGHMAISVGVYIGRDAECGHGLLPYMRTGFAFLTDSMRIDFEHCLQAAWDAIKDRKGRMVEGGVFVKEESSAEQRLAELKDEMARLEEQMEAIGAGGVTRGQRLMNRKEQ